MNTSFHLEFKTIIFCNFNFADYDYNNYTE